MMDHVFAQWRTLALKSLLAGTALDRIDADELHDLLDGKLAGCDPTRNACADPDELDLSTPAPVTPYELLVAETGVARDFRDVTQWNRLQRYDPKIYGYPADKSRGQSLGVREWINIDTLILHTAAALLHVDRGLGVPSHALVATNGDLALQHFLDAYLAAAHRANSYSVSLEISGHGSITDKQVPVAQAWCRYAVGMLRLHHAQAGVEKPIKVGPHRVSHKSRVRDCDPAIWREVGEFCIDELGCVVADVVGTGTKIPRVWWSEPMRENR